MKPAPFSYHRPQSVDEAVDLLDRLGDDSRPLAGGQSLVPLLAMRLATPAHLVDLNRLPELARIDERDGTLVIGGLVRQRTAERSPLVHQWSPLLAEALPLIGHPQIRTRGTIGGSLAHADPAAELPLALVVLEGDIVVRSARGERVIPATEFFVSHFTTSMAPGEILVEVRVPATGERTGWAFREVARRHGDFAIVGVAAMVRLDADGTVAEVRVGVSGVEGVPLRVPAAEAVLRGEVSTEATIEAAAQAVVTAVNPTTDIHATAAYRAHVAGVLARGALLAAAARAQGEA